MAESMIFTLEMFEDAQKYWAEKLSGELAELNLVGDFPGTTGTHQANETVHQISFGTTISETLFRISKNNDVALYVILAAAFKVLLFKFTGQTDIIITSPTLKKSQQNYNKFVALRDYLEPGMTFKNFLMKARETAVQGYKNQFYPIRKLIKFLNIENTAVLFKVIMLLDTIHHQYPLEEIKNSFKNDILVSLSKNDGMLKGNVIYNSRLYKPGTLYRLTDCYIDFLNLILNNMDSEISGIDIFSEAEKRRILFDFNDTSREFPRDKTLQELFEEQAEKTPDLKAVIDIGHPETESPALNYLQLNEKSHQLARLLREKGVQSETVVAILAEPSIEMIVGLLGILRAGAAYLPIDTGYPEERINYMLGDSASKVLVTTQDLSKEIKFEKEIIYLADPINRTPTPPHLHLPSRVNSPATCLAYVIYTSGTTGKPKGVMVKHRNVVRLVKNPNYIHLKQGQRLLLTGVMTFDITTFEIWAPLLNGLSLYLADENTILDPQRLGEALEENKISILHLVPQLFNQMAAWNTDIFAGLRYLLVGGDLVKPQYINKLRNEYERLCILHMYGPTENTTFTTFFPIEKNYESGIPIGKPVSNSSVYILDHCRQLVPVGAVGELYTGGAGVARGYLNNPELTFERFISFNRSYMSYKSYISDKLYKTGDLARWLPDGNIEFLGRVDQQVKIRGIRIEPGEIENLLLKLPRVKEAVVLAREIPASKSSTDKDEKYLCAYIAADEELNIPGIKDHLSGYLPVYMLPQYIVRVPAMPLTANGKLDRKALPVPRVKPEDQYVPPADKMEEKLVEMWADILGIEEKIIGVHTSFFDLGGHSLKATVLTTRIHKELSVKLPLMEIFNNPTIRGLTQYIKQSSLDGFERIQPVEKREYYALSAAQQRLYFLQQMNPRSTVYHLPQALPLPGQPSGKKLADTFKKLLQRHESLRTSFHIVDNTPVQRVHHEVPFEIQYYEPGQETHFVRPFQLDRPPLVRIAIACSRTGNGGGIDTLLVDAHHIIVDAQSDALLVKDFLSLYNGDELQQLKLQYKDFAHWQNRLTASGEIKKQEAYWLEELGKELPPVRFPTDYGISRVRSFQGAQFNFFIGREETAALNQIALEQRSTLYMLLLAIYNIFLWKMSDQTDIIIGTPTAGRRHADLENIAGMFVNTVLLRNYPTAEKSFTGFLEEIKERTLTAFENQDYQCEELVEKLDHLRDMMHIGFSFMNTQQQQPQETHTTTTGKQGEKQWEIYEHNTSKADLTLFIRKIGNKLYLTFEYSTNVFKEETIRRYGKYFHEIVSAVVKNKNIKLREISLTHDLLIPGTDLLQETRGDFGF